VDSTTLYDEILYNSIFSNTGLGIDLGDDGVTQNTPGGPHTGPNEFQNFPVLSVNSGVLTVSLNSTANALFIIQLFVATPDPSGYGQGKSVLETFTITTDPSGNGSAQVNLPPGEEITATATDSLGDTSEFSQYVP
jgi:titin